MPKPYTLPTLYNEVLQFKLCNIKRDGFFAPNIHKSGVTTWTNRDGDKLGSISFIVNTLAVQPYIELDYKHRDTPRKYKIFLVSVPSNLGKGKVWYFICPQTNKRCRKLYCIGGYFLHREAFNGCMYDSQIVSKHYRALDKTLGAYYRSDGIYEQLSKKYFKKNYAGKPTKKYLKLKRQLEQIDRYSLNDIVAMEQGLF